MTRDQMLLRLAEGLEYGKMSAEETIELLRSIIRNPSFPSLQVAISIEKMLKIVGI